MTQIEQMANEAIFILQMNSADAVSYIRRNAQCERSQAQAALKSVLSFGRK